MKFTIFTPTYNRKELIKKLYESLKKQTYKSFEWLIVDDGSQDGTGEIINKYIDEKVLDIKYYYVKNGGKQRAYNYAAKKAQGELFICLDSDDEYVENALNTILNYWKKYENNLEIAGMCYLSIYSNGEIIGSEFPKNEMVDTQFNIYNKYGVKGDKGIMFRSEIIKKFPFPIFDDEKFITEAVVYNRICNKYKMLYVNEKIEIKEYQGDGLTSKYEKLLISNPKGQSLYYNEMNFYKMSLKKRILVNALYYKFSKIGKLNIFKMYFKSKNKLFFILSLPLGIYMYTKGKMNRKY